ncbi:MAG: serine/threonine-protein phosphatase [Bacteroidetes bacterium]|nr:serine/threonine-protein phosphatase [Bacteroidota bacterium]
MYQYIDIAFNQKSKIEGTACGDVFSIARSPHHTTIILCDGKGHGIKANFAAAMNVSYLSKLLQSGFSLRQAFDSLVDFFNQVGTEGGHYAVFSMMRIHNDGMANILSFSMPPPIFISPIGAKILNLREIETENGIINEANCYIKNTEAIMLMSDGVTQAGIGRGLDWGWTSEGVCKFINENYTHKSIDYIKLSNDITQQVFTISNNNYDDDITNIIGFARTGKVCNIITGPPAEKKNDCSVVRKFMSADGCKIVCGGTTANVVSSVLNTNLIYNNEKTNPFTPPEFIIKGVDLATEGAITLNQLYNIIDENRKLMNEDSPVTKLFDKIMEADKIVFWLGINNQSDNNSLEFIQRGIKSRQNIIPSLANRLKELGKLVIINKI